MSKPWRGKLSFSVYRWTDGIDHNDMYSGSPDDVDICDFLNGGNGSAEKLYFCQKEFPPPKDQKMLYQCCGWKELRRRLEKSALECGNPIISNGSYTNAKGEISKRFKCGYCYRNTRETMAQEVSDDNPYRITTLIHDKKNSRGISGRSGPKRIKTTSKECICKFGFSVKVDNYGFYIHLKRNAGHPIHNDHPKPLDPSTIPIPSRLLDDNEREDILHVVESTCQKPIGRNFMHGKFGKFINSLKIDYLYKKFNKSDHAADDIANMLSDFETSKEISFTSLSNVPVEEYFESANCVNESSNSDTTEQKTMTMQTTRKENGKVTNCQLNESDNDLTSSPIDDIAEQERIERNLRPSQVLFIAIAWTLVPAFRLFMLCPEVIWCDVTSHSNNKGFSLLTFSCRTSVGKQVIFLWIWIPNEQRFSFRWVFHHAIPTLIPLSIREKVKFIMKDGDPQQRNEILKSLKTIFTNAGEGSCGWHIGMFFV